MRAEIAHRGEAPWAAGAHGPRCRAWAVVERDPRDYGDLERALAGERVVGLFGWRGRAAALELAEGLTGARPRQSTYRIHRLRSRGGYDCGRLSVVPVWAPVALVAELDPSARPQGRAA